MPLRFFEEEWHRRLILLTLWCMVMFAFSEMPGSGLEGTPPLWYVLERKSAHVVEYAVLAFLSFRFFVAMYPSERFSCVTILSGVFALAFGALDEFHQSFVFGRGARLTDVAIDGIGIALALAAIYLFRTRRP